jgi:hypothetical protein
LLKILSTPGIKNEQDILLAGLQGLASGAKKSEIKIKADQGIEEALQSFERDSSNEIKAVVGEIRKLME